MSGRRAGASSTGTLGKAMAVLELVALSDRPLRFTDILERAGQPRGTLHRQLSHLVQEGLLDLTQPGWRDEVVSRRFLPELTVSGALPSVRWEQSEGPRGPAVPGADGLFVAGDWVGPDGMLADRAIQSGRRAGLAAAAGPAGSPAAASR